MRTASIHRSCLPPLLALMLVAIPADGRAWSAGQQQRRPAGAQTSELEEMMRSQQLEQAPGLFGAIVSRVRVDVIVTDENGEFVSDLSADDFVVYEDGEAQEIIDVQLVDIPAGLVNTLRAGDAAAAAPAEPMASAAADEPGAVADAAGEVDEAAGAAANPAAALGAIIFLIDAPSLDQQAKARFGDAWEQILDDTDVPQVPRAAYMFTNYGRIEELAPLSTDLESIRGAAEAVREAPFFGNSMRQKLTELSNDVTSSTATRTQDLARQLAAAKARGFEVEETNRSLATYELLTNLADSLWTRSGRTAVVWVSRGVKLMQGGPFAALIAFDPRFASVADGDPAAVDEGLAGAKFTTYSPDARIQAAQERLHRAANAANVSIYSVDPSLLASTRQIGGDVEVGNADAAQMLSTRELETSIDAMRDSMRQASAQTGGRSFIQDTDIGLALAEIERDTSRFYLVSYAPPDATGDGEYHEIRVDVDRPGVEVRARGGYVDYPAEDRVRRGLEVALALPGLANDLPVSAEAFRSRPPVEGPNLMSAVAVHGNDLGVAVGAQGEREVSLDIHSVVFNDGGIVDEAHERLAARAGPDGRFVAGADSELTPTLTGFLAYQHEWTLEPGSYTLNIGVLDNITGRVGGASLEVEIPEPTPGEWGTSDPVLAALNDAGGAQPVVRGQVVERQSVTAFLEVYGGVTPVLSGQVFLEGAEDDRVAQGARLFPLAMRPAGPGIHRGSLLLPPGIPPGRYTVQLTVTDEPVSRNAIRRVTLEVLEPGAGR